MCSIGYEPCDDQSFRIGPMRMNRPPGSGMLGPGNGMLGPGGNPMGDVAMTGK